MKILCIHSNTGSRFYRVNPQLKWMQQQGHEVRLEQHDSKYIDQLVDWCDVLILQMVFSQEIAQEAKEKGKMVYFDCDDLIHKTHKLHYAYNETKGIKNQLKWWWRMFKMFRTIDGLIVSTPRLKHTYGWMAKRVLVFPNYLDLPHWLKEQKKNYTSRVRILWAGSTSHTGDLYWVKPIMKNILEKYPHVQFIYMGHGGVPTDDLYAKFVYGEDAFEGLPYDRRESLLPAPPNVFPYILAGIQADIAIAPLEKNTFNKYKSQCKYLEYAVNGIPGVYSKWFYSDVIDDRDFTTLGSADDFSTGLLADTPEEWIEALSLLIENATIRNKIGDSARTRVIERNNFVDHAATWQGFVEISHNESPRTKKTSTS